MMAAVLLVGMTSCSKEDNPAPNIKALEQELVGLWWDEFEYADVTEAGVLFSRVLLAVKADADHTGCIYAGVFNDKDDNPLAIYGGPKDAGFTWQLLVNGKVLLSDPTSGESVELAPARRASNGNYGETMTDVGSTNVSYADNSMTVTNNEYSGTLEKANAEKSADIDDKLQALITAVNGGDTGIGYNGQHSDTARAPRH